MKIIINDDVDLQTGNVVFDTVKYSNSKVIQFDKNFVNKPKIICTPICFNNLKHNQQFEINATSITTQGFHLTYLNHDHNNTTHAISWMAIDDMDNDLINCGSTDAIYFNNEDTVFQKVVKFDKYFDNAPNVSIFLSSFRSTDVRFNTTLNVLNDQFTITIRPLINDDYVLNSGWVKFDYIAVDKQATCFSVNTIHLKYNQYIIRQEPVIEFPLYKLPFETNFYNFVGLSNLKFNESLTATDNDKTNLAIVSENSDVKLTTSTNGQHKYQLVEFTISILTYYGGYI